MTRWPYLVAIALTVACRDRASAPSPGSAPSAVEATPPAEPEHPLSRDPIYELDLALTNQRGAPIPLSIWRGHPTVISMFYGTCTVACPRLFDEVQRFEAGLSPAQRADLRVLLVSFDPARDTPARLTALAGEHHLDDRRWQLATAPDPVLRELAAVLGIRYRVLDSGEFFHTSVQTLVDRDGRPLARVEGLGRSAQPLIEALAALPSP